MQAIFITGIGTDVGKTVIAAIITEALHADYWKPIQAGYAEGTDELWVKERLSNNSSKIYPETYKLKLAASPHIAARGEGVEIDLNKIEKSFLEIRNKKLEMRNEKQGSPQSTFQPINLSTDHLIIEGAGGLLVPLNEKEFVVDVIKKLQAKVILVSRNYLGSINHSLMTAAVCKQHQLDVIGWIFNDQYLHYENEIEQWSGLPKIASVPFSQHPDKAFILQQADAIRPALGKYL
jgi:dethiobiotin synthetase